MSKIESKKLEQHPLALSLVPGTMPEEELEAFSADIAKRGVQVPITLYQGKVLDGWHRYGVCQKLDITPKFIEYTGDDAAGLVISLNVLRRKLGTTQRALAGARLNLEYSVGQDEASKRVGVSKLHINLVVQALNSKNARVLKMLENPELTRAALYEEMVDCSIIRGATVPTPSNTLTTAGSTMGLDALFKKNAEDTDDTDDDDLLGGGEGFDEDSPELDSVLGAPPSANGKVLSTKSGATDGGITGTRPTHPERRNRDTPAYQVAEKFKALDEADRVSFLQLSWHMIRPLIGTAGLSATGSTPAELRNSPVTEFAPSKQTSAQSAKAAAAAAAADPAAVSATARALEAITKAASGKAANKPGKARSKAVKA